jgi:hypothetical protein
MVVLWAGFLKFQDLTIHNQQSEAAVATATAATSAVVT